MIDQLKKLSLNGGDFRGARTAFGQTLEGLRTATNVVRSLEFVDRSLGANLLGQLDAAELLQLQSGGEPSPSAVASWAGQTLERVLDVKESLGDTRAPKDREKAREKLGSAIEAIAGLTSEVAAQQDKLTAWQRASILSHIGQRLTALNPSLPDDVNQDLAELARTTALTEAVAQYRLSSGASGAATMAMLYESVTGLAQSVATAKDEPSEEQLKAVSAALDGVFGLFASDVPGTQHTLELLEPITRARRVDSRQRSHLERSEPGGLRRQSAGRSSATRRARRSHPECRRARGRVHRSLQLRSGPLVCGGRCVLRLRPDAFDGNHR